MIPAQPATGERRPMAELVRRGLRAQLQSGNLLTGELLVDLTFAPGAPPAELDTSGPIPVIPSVPTTIEALQASVTAIMNKVASLPIEELLASLNRTAGGLDRLVNAPETQEALHALGPVTLPAYLDRPDIVTRAGANQMRLGDFSQWAEPLEPLLTRIMAEDFYALTGAKDVIPIPQRGDLPLDRVVEVDFARFDADEAGAVKLDARWRVYRGDNETLVASGRSQVAEQGAAVPDYDAIVAAMSRAVGQLSAEIATGIAAGPPPVRIRKS